MIPNGGCAGCVQETEHYYLQHKEESRTLFLFTNYLSRKELRIKLGKDLLERKNVRLGKENELYFPNYKESLYPCVILLSDGNIERFANLDELL